MGNKGLILLHVKRSVNVNIGRAISQAVVPGIFSQTPKYTPSIFWLSKYVPLVYCIWCDKSNFTTEVQYLCILIIFRNILIFLSKISQGDVLQIVVKISF